MRSQFDVHVFDSLPSTNAKLWEMIAAKTGGAGTVVIAQQQTAGRGQRGRVWNSEPGGLYLSLALEPDWPVGRSAQLTCMSAWGIATALNNLGIPVRLKWPNDLFFEGKKLGGILTETKIASSEVRSPASAEGVQSPPRIKQAVIGVGLNWQNSVPETGITLKKIMAQLPDCAAQNKINCLEVLAAVILKGILQGVLFQQQVGSQVFMKAYSNLLTQVGKVVSLDSNLLRLAVTDEHFGKSAHRLDEQTADRSAAQQLVGQFANRSGEIVGVTEEGYLEVAISDVDASDLAEAAATGHTATCKAIRKAIRKRAGPQPNIADSAAFADDKAHSVERTDSSRSLGRTTTNILLFKPSEICIS